MKNAYGLWFEAGRQECWVQRASWKNYVARLISMRTPSGPPPYYGNCGFEYEVYDLNGNKMDWDEIKVWGSYQWLPVERPSWFSEQAA